MKEVCKRTLEKNISSWNYLLKKSYLDFNIFISLHKIIVILIFNSNNQGFILHSKRFPAILFGWVSLKKFCLEIIHLLLL